MAGADFCGKALAALILSFWKIKIYMTRCGKALAALSLSLWKIKIYLTHLKSLGQTLH